MKSTTFQLLSKIFIVTIILFQCFLINAQTTFKVNLIKHNVTFEEATAIFGDHGTITIESPDNLIREKRFVTLALHPMKK